MAESPLFRCVWQELALFQYFLYRQLLEPPELDSKGTAQDAARNFLTEFLGEDVVPFNKIDLRQVSKHHQASQEARDQQRLFAPRVRRCRPPSTAARAAA